MERAKLRDKLAASGQRQVRGVILVILEGSAADENSIAATEGDGDCTYAETIVVG